MIFDGWVVGKADISPSELYVLATNIRFQSFLLLKMIVMGNSCMFYLIIFEIGSESLQIA